MIVYSINLAPKARKRLLRLDRPLRNRLTERMMRLAEWPETGLDVKPLKGERAGEYRLRVGEYRVVFIVVEEPRHILVRKIGPRGRVY